MSFHTEMTLRKFVTEKSNLKKVIGGKRTVDAVTGPPIQKQKPKRLEPTIAKIAKGVVGLFTKKEEMAVHPVGPIIKKRKTVKKTPIIRKK